MTEPYLLKMNHLVTPDSLKKLVVQKHPFVSVAQVSSKKIRSFLVFSDGNLIDLPYGTGGLYLELEKYIAGVHEELVDVFSNRIKMFQNEYSFSSKEIALVAYLGCVLVSVVYDESEVHIFTGINWKQEEIIEGLVGLKKNLVWFLYSADGTKDKNKGDYQDFLSFLVEHGLLDFKKIRQDMPE